MPTTKCAFSIRVRSIDESGCSFDKTLTINIVNQLEGTSASDEFVLTFITLTLSKHGATPVNQGTYNITPQLKQQGFRGVGLTSADTIWIVGASAGEIFELSGSVVIANELPFFLGTDAKSSSMALLPMTFTRSTPMLR